MPELKNNREGDYNYFKVKLTKYALLIYLYLAFLHPILLGSKKWYLGLQ